MYISIFLPVVIAIAINAWIYLNDKHHQSQSQSNTNNNNMLPPGAVIGVVWIILLGMLGYVQYITSGYSMMASLAVITLIILCLLYPIITRLRQNMDIYNRVALIYAFMVAIMVVLTAPCRKCVREPGAIWYMIPLLAWLSYVNLVYGVTEQFNNNTFTLTLGVPNHYTSTRQLDLRRQWLNATTAEERQWYNRVFCDECSPLPRDPAAAPAKPCENDWDCNPSESCRVRPSGPLGSRKYCVLDSVP